MDHQAPDAAVARAINRVLAAEPDAAGVIAAAQREAEAAIEAARAERRRLLERARVRAARLHAAAQARTERELRELDLGAVAGSTSGPSFAPTGTPCDGVSARGRRRGT